MLRHNLMQCAVLAVLILACLSISSGFLVQQPLFPHPTQLRAAAQDDSNHLHHINSTVAQLPPLTPSLGGSMAGVTELLPLAGAPVPSQDSTPQDIFAEQQPYQTRPDPIDELLQFYKEAHLPVWPESSYMQVRGVNVHYKDTDPSG
jgi:hypothetical protein